MKRFYYKNKDNTGFLNLKSALIDENYIQITKEEFEELTKPKEPTAEERAAQEKTRKITEYKKYLQDTDYIVLKIAERLAEGDTATVKHLKATYTTELAKREEAREKINELEVK